MERRHAEQWAARLRDQGSAPPVVSPSPRARVLGWLARVLGPAVILPTVVSLEQVDSHAYALQAAPDLARQERSHARLLREIAGGRSGLVGGAIAQFEGRHRAVGGNAFRAAVLGATMDWSPTSVS